MEFVLFIFKTWNIYFTNYGLKKDLRYRCAVVELALVGSATDGANPASIFIKLRIVATLLSKDQVKFSELHLDFPN